jgi:hypothetical protein
MAYTTTAERKELREKIDAVNADARANWDDPSWRRAMAQEMSEVIREGFEHESLLSIMAEVENAPFDGRVTVSEVKGLKAHWVARGGYIESSTLVRQTMELPRDTIGFHVSEMEDKLMTNFAETQSTLIELGTQRLDAQVNARVLALFQAAAPVGDANGNYETAAGLTLTILNTMLREVRDETKTGEVTIVGRSTQTEQVMDLLLGTDQNGAGFLPESNEDMVRRGLLGTYRGANIVTLVNHKDDAGVSFFPDDELFVIGRDSSKFAFWGGMMVKEYSEQDAWYWHYIARRDFGGIVHRPSHFRRFVDTT